MKSRTMVVVVAAMVVLALLSVAGSAVAGPPKTGPAQEGDVQLAGTVASQISYQGRLTNAAGSPLSGNYNLVFQLWNDATAGSQVGSDIVKNGVPVSNGLFTVELDVPQGAFKGQALWLRIQVNGQWLSPRQPLLPAPYALSLRPGARIVGAEGSYAVLSVSNGSPGGIWVSQKEAIVGWTSDGIALAGIAGTGTGVLGRSFQFRGVSGTSDTNDGVVGQSEGDGKSGVYGVNSHTGGFGVFGRNTARENIGYLGGTYGAYGESGANTGTGVFGKATASYGRGVIGYSTGSLGIGVMGEAPGNDAYGVYAQATGARGIGIYARGGPGGYAAEFRGNVKVTSSATAATIIELGEGLDFAEGFDVTDGAAIEPGTVLVIDPEHPGQLMVSDRPYDRRVAGIVAGANGLGSGVRLGVDAFDYDVALAGRVYCNVDATYGEVSPGDLLTTSPTPGYAMVVMDHEKAQGAILGKAMEGLPAGQKGQILVLVTLQ